MIEQRRLARRLGAKDRDEVVIEARLCGAGNFEICVKIGTGRMSTRA
jgi:hypothetical protein